jgi:hypothetical protein
LVDGKAGTSSPTASTGGRDDRHPREGERKEERLLNPNHPDLR